MKKLLLLVLVTVLVPFSGFAQEFNGQISYNFGIKGEHTARLAAMMPRSIDLYFLDGNVLLRMQGGTLAEKTGDFLTKSGEAVFYLVVHAEKTVYRVDPEKENIDTTETPPIITLEATETVNGYNCKKYLLKFAATENREIYQYMWCTDDINITKPRGGGPMGIELFREDIPGFPVKIIQYITVKQKNSITINQEITLDKVSEFRPDTALFAIPQTYQQKDGDEFGK